VALNQGDSVVGSSMSDSAFAHENFTDLEVSKEPFNSSYPLAAKADSEADAVVADSVAEAASGQLLKKAMLSLSQAVEGQDKNLDLAVARLRTQLKAGNLQSATLLQINSASSSLESIRRTRADNQLRGFSACVAQLLKLEPPEEVRRELAAFVRHARKFILRPDEQQLLALRLAKVQKKSLEHVAGVLGSEGSLAQEGRKEGQPAEQSVSDEADILEIESLYQDDSIENLPPYTTVAEAIEDILVKMLAEINVSDKARESWENANRILSKGLNWYELAALLEQIAQLVHDSLLGDQEELELFLQDLNVRLQQIHGGVEGVGEVNASLEDCADTLDSDLREGISSLADEVSNASSLDALKKSVINSMDSVVGQLDQFQGERSKLQQQHQAHVKELTARIAELEVSASNAQQELEAQQQRNEIDELTGLPNRSAYDRMGTLEMARWERYQQGFCLVVADIDFFKSVNDKYGHLAGDKVLAVVARTIRKRLRRVDFIARYGGEEFVILLPASEAEEARGLMENLGREIREAPFHYDKSPLRITVSFGVAEVAEGDSLETLFGRADTALYKAKASGRDCTVVATVEE